MQYDDGSGSHPCLSQGSFTVKLGPIEEQLLEGWLDPWGERVGVDPECGRGVSYKLQGGAEGLRESQSDES